MNSGSGQAPPRGPRHRQQRIDIGSENGGPPDASRRLSYPADMAMLALLVAVAAWLSLWLSLQPTHAPDTAAAVWVGNGLFVGWLLSRPSRRWPGYLAAGFLAEALVRQWSGDYLLQRFEISLANLVEVLIVAGAVRRLVPDVGDPRGWLALGRIATGSTLVACAVSGLVAAAIMSATFGTAFKVGWLSWYGAHVIGMVVVAPFTMIVLREGWASLEIGWRADIVGWGLVLIAVAGGVFAQTRYPLLFLAFPPLLWGAFRHRFAGAVIGVSLLAAIGGIATALDRGPLAIAGLSDPQRALLLQVFLGTACLTTFPIALAMAERARMTSRVRDSEQRYRMLADYSHDLVVRMRADGEPLYVSPSARDILGWEPQELLQSRWDLIHPEDRIIHLEAMAAVVASGEPGTATCRLRHKHGHYIWIEAVARPIPSADDDGTMNIIYAGRDVSQRIAAEQALLASQRELETLARVDSLTGLPNRRQFDERLALAVARSQRPGLPVALVYLDIDHFKQINDSLGHGAGDHVLRTFARRLLGSVRAGDLVARLGGDEFAVLVEDAALPDAAKAIARKLIATMAEAITVDTTSAQATTSIGIAFCSGRTRAAELMAAADAALYRAKKAGRNTFELISIPGAPRPSTGGSVAAMPP